MNIPALPENTTPPEPQTPDVPEGMVAWAGGDHAPDDIGEAAQVQHANGTIGLANKRSILWGRPVAKLNPDRIGDPSGPPIEDMWIIAYTPHSEQPAIVGGVDREAEQFAANAWLALCHASQERPDEDRVSQIHRVVAEQYHLAALTARPSAPAEVECAASPDHADIVETIDNAADDWQAKGYTSALAEVRDMANVGRALMEALPAGYHYNDCPSEIVSDLINERDEALATPSPVEPGSEREALEHARAWLNGDRLKSIDSGEALRVACLEDLIRMIDLARPAADDAK